MPWHFCATSTETLASRWLWIREDEEHRIIARSTHTFDNCANCLRDALRNGYAVPDARVTTALDA